MIEPLFLKDWAMPPITFTNDFVQNTPEMRIMSLFQKVDTNVIALSLFQKCYYDNIVKTTCCYDHLLITSLFLEVMFLLIYYAYVLICNLISFVCQIPHQKAPTPKL